MPVCSAVIYSQQENSERVTSILWFHINLLVIEIIIQYVERYFGINSLLENHLISEPGKDPRAFTSVGNVVIPEPNEKIH